MSTSLVDIAKNYVESEAPTRREKTKERINQLNQKYGLGGGWRLIQPGPLWEACEIWLEETRQFGFDAIEHVLKHQDAPSRLGPSAEVESLRRFISEWAHREQEEYIMPHLIAYMQERGIKEDVKEQQLGNTKERIQWGMAQATKELLTRIHEAGQTSQAAA